MNALRILCLVACTITLVAANMSGNSLNDKLQPREWLSASELEQLPSVDQITFEQLENMPAEAAADLINKIYHLAQIEYKLRPTFVPSPSEIPAYIATPNGARVKFMLNELVTVVKQQPNFAQQELSILITGLPKQSPAAAKAIKKLIHAYMQRYSVFQQPSWKHQEYADSKEARTSSDEDYSHQATVRATGNLIVIELGEVFQKYTQWFMLDVDRTGAMIGRLLVQLTNEVNVPQEIMHVIAQGVAAHVAGAAGREYTRLTGHKLRRITALDPSRVFVKNENRLTGLTRGDAEFVDAIHTSAYGMGTATRVGNVDFYPNGPCVAVPGAENLIESSMRATRYYAESVLPGNERNFPAMAASSLEEYKANKPYGPRAFMGIDAEFDLEGDYILQVNPNGPFGRRAPAQTHGDYYNLPQAWKHA